MPLTEPATRLWVVLLTIVLLIIPDLCLAQEKFSKPPKSWGLGMGLRTAEIPYKTDKRQVHDIVPLFYYQGDHFFLEGLTAGVRLPLNERLAVAAVARYRFFDIPAEEQNRSRKHALDMGAQLRYALTERTRVVLETLVDHRGHAHATAELNYRWETGRVDLTPFVRLRWKEAGFNNFYYGLGVTSPGAGVDASAGVQGRYQIHENLYLIGQLTATRLDDATYDAGTIEHRTQLETFVGIGIMNDRQERPRNGLKSRPYLRLAHGWATPSDMGEIVTLKIDDDPFNNQMTSIFYGHPLTDELFRAPIPVYLTPGLVVHHSSEVQEQSLEYVLAIKFYYTFKLPVRLRAGFAEGLSFADGIPYVEQAEMEQRGYRPSKFLNFLDFSFDLNIGDLVRQKSLENLWLGFSIHHRSGIFSTSSAFGRISGGSNILSGYLQYHF